jgi:hypothetical protein
VVEAIASGGSDAVQFASERLRSYGAQVLKAKVQADVEQATTFMQEVSETMAPFCFYLSQGLFSFKWLESTYQK